MMWGELEGHDSHHHLVESDCFPFHTSQCKIPQMFLIVFNSELKAGQPKTIIYRAESYCFVLCEMLIEVLSFWNLHSGTPKMSSNGNRRCNNVFWYLVEFCYPWRNTIEVIKVNRPKIISDLLSCRLLKKVSGCFSRSCP